MRARGVGSKTKSSSSVDWTANRGRSRFYEIRGTPKSAINCSSCSWGGGDVETNLAQSQEENRESRTGNNHLSSKNQKFIRVLSTAKTSFFLFSFFTIINCKLGEEVGLFQRRKIRPPGTAWNVLVKEIILGTWSDNGSNTKDTPEVEQEEEQYMTQTAEQGEERLRKEGRGDGETHTGGWKGTRDDN